MESNKVKKLYDELSNKYDSIFKKSLFWQLSDDITFDFMNHYIKSNMSILDLGCGTGEYGLYYLLKGNLVDFIDISEDMLNQVRNKLKLLNVNEEKTRFFKKDITSSEFYLPKKYDVIIMEGDVLGYCLEKDADILTKLQDYLTKDGIVFIGVDNLMAKTMDLVNRNEIKNLKNFFTTHITKCPYGLPIKQYSPKTFKDILPNTFKLISYIGKPILLPYLNDDKKAIYMETKATYNELKNIEEQLINWGYSDWGSHYTFLIKKT